MRFLTTIFFCVLFSCSQTKDKNLYVGDLRFTDVRFWGSLYNLPDSTIKGIKSTLDTVDINNETLNSNGISQLLLNLKEQNLLYKPYIDLQQNDSETLVCMFLDSVDYEQFRKYKWKDLQDENKKVMVWAKTNKIIQSGQVTFLYCTDLVDVKVVEGETFPIGRQKLKILDYE